MAEPARVLEQIAHWEDLSPRHLVMLEALTETVVAAEATIKTFKGLPTAEVWRAASWIDFAGVFVDVAESAKESRDFQLLLRLIERGYRRLLFLRSEAVRELGNLEGKDSEMLVLDGPDIEKLRDRKG